MNKKFKRITLTPLLSKILSENTFRKIFLKTNFDSHHLNDSIFKKRNYVRNSLRDQLASWPKLCSGSHTIVDNILYTVLYLISCMYFHIQCCCYDSYALFFCSILSNRIGGIVITRNPSTALLQTK